MINADINFYKIFLRYLQKKKTTTTKLLEAQLIFYKLTSAVMDPSSGIDGLPAEFYRCFWTVVGYDFF